MVGVVGQADGDRHGADEGKPGLGLPRESFLLFARRAHSFIAPQKKCSAPGTLPTPISANGARKAALAEIADNRPHFGRVALQASSPQISTSQRPSTGS